MEVVRQFVDAKKLKSIIPLPENMQEGKLEIIILPVEKPKAGVENSTQIEKIVDSLVGAIPDHGMSLDDYRAERLEKYEVID